MRSSPTPSSERFELVDIIRGFALFGVLLSNLLWTTQYFSFDEEQRSALPTADLDTVASNLAIFFVSYKFYTLFSMLFGLGFAMQLIRASDRGGSVVPTYLRRLVILLTIGGLHTCFLWFGDILFLYAQLGFVLVLFRHKSDRVVLGGAIGIAGIVLLLPALYWIMTAGAPELADDAAKSIDAERFATMKSGGYAQIVALNWGVFMEGYSSFSLEPDGTIHWYLSVMWKFLLGFYIGRRMLLQESQKHLELARRILPWALAIGLAGNAVMVIALVAWDIWIPAADSALMLAWIPVEIGIFALSLAYLCGLVLLFHHRRWRRYVNALAPVGRMALTNYLTHSVLFVVLFYGIGFELLGEVGAAWCVLIALGIFGIQMLGSAWWLRRFRFGPMEWIWRSLTYARMQPFRNHARADVRTGP